MQKKETILISNINNEKLLIGEISNDAIRTHDGVKNIRFKKDSPEDNSDDSDFTMIIGEVPVDDTNTPLSTNLNVYIQKENLLIKVDTLGDLDNLPLKRSYSNVLDNFNPFRDINLVLWKKIFNWEKFNRDSSEFNQYINTEDSLLTVKFPLFYYKTYWTSVENKIKGSSIDSSIYNYVRYYKIISAEEYNKHPERYSDFSSPTAFQASSRKTSLYVGVCPVSLITLPDEVTPQTHIFCGYRDKQNEIDYPPKKTFKRTELNLITYKINELDYFYINSSAYYEVITYLLRIYFGTLKLKISNITSGDYPNNRQFILQKNFLSLDNSSDTNEDVPNVLYSFYLSNLGCSSIFTLSDIIIAPNFSEHKCYYNMAWQNHPFSSSFCSLLDQVYIPSAGSGVSITLYYNKFICDNTEINIPYINNICLPSNFSMTTYSNNIGISTIIINNSYLYVTPKASVSNTNYLLSFINNSYADDNTDLHLTLCIRDD